MATNLTRQTIRERKKKAKSWMWYGENTRSSYHCLEFMYFHLSVTYRMIVKLIIH